LVALGILNYFPANLQYLSEIHKKTALFRNRTALKGENIKYSREHAAKVRFISSLQNKKGEKSA